MKGAIPDFIGSLHASNKRRFVVFCVGRSRGVIWVYSEQRERTAKATFVVQVFYVKSIKCLMTFCERKQAGAWVRCHGDGPRWKKDRVGVKAVRKPPGSCGTSECTLGLEVDVRRQRWVFATREWQIIPALATSKIGLRYFLFNWKLRKFGGLGPFTNPTGSSFCTLGFWGAGYRRGVLVRSKNASKSQGKNVQCALLENFVNQYYKEVSIVYLVDSVPKEK